MQMLKRRIAGIAILFILVCLYVWMKPMDRYSAAERRKLAVFPVISVENILHGKFMEDFEAYASDQFPLRDELRSLKAVTSLKRDNHGLYLVDGYLNSMEYPLNKASLFYASKIFQNICGKYLKENSGQIYLSVIPDKNYFFAEENGYLALDYEEMITILCEQNSNMQYIDIFPLLSTESYYRTDIHWRQEMLLPVAEKLLSSMASGGDKKSGGILENYQKNVVEEDFYGVFYGQAALPVKPDKITCLTNEVQAGFTVYDHQNTCRIPVYDLKKAKGRDPYEMFLGGSLSLLTIENAQAATDRNLIIFRDSFGSSIAPFLAEKYAKTVLVDIRYIQSGTLERYVEFENADILFLYSVPVLNHSETLK